MKIRCEGPFENDTILQPFSLKLEIILQSFSLKVKFGDLQHFLFIIVLVTVGDSAMGFQYRSEIWSFFD